MQDCSISITYALGILLSSTEPSICYRYIIRTKAWCHSTDERNTFTIHCFCLFCWKIVNILISVVALLDYICMYICVYICALQFLNWFEYLVLPFPINLVLYLVVFRQYSAVRHVGYYYWLWKFYIQLLWYFKEPVSRTQWSHFNAGWPGLKMKPGYIRPVSRRTYSVASRCLMVQVIRLLLWYA